MNKRKLVVLSVDALVTEDLALAKELPGFGAVIKNGCGVKQVKSVFPTLTYPIHVVQVTGRNMMDTGVYNNEAFQPGKMEPDWCWDADYIKVPTIFDAARNQGLSTCAIMWPVLANAAIDFNIPEVWDMDNWDDPHRIYRKYCSPKGYEYFKKHVDKLGWHPKPAYDEFAICLAKDILEHEMPDLSFIHVSTVDIARHYHGLFCKEVTGAIVQVDGWICQLMEAIQASGYGECTDFIIVSDHGHLMITKELNLNVIFREHGLITVDTQGQMLDYQAYCHSASLSGQIMLKEPQDPALYGKVWDLLWTLQKERSYGIKRIYTKEEARQEFRLSGPFSFVVEGEEGTAFGHAHTGRAVILSVDEDYTYVVTGHGHRPEIGPQPVFIASGPDFCKGVWLEHAGILDELPTFASLFSLKLPNLEGRALTELLLQRE